MPSAALSVFITAARTRTISDIAPLPSIFVPYLDFCRDNGIDHLAKLMMGYLAPIVDSKQIHHLFVWASKFNDIGSAATIVARGFEPHQHGDSRTFRRIDPADPLFHEDVSQFRGDWMWPMGAAQRQLEAQHNWKMPWHEEKLWSEWAGLFVRFVRSGEFTSHPDVVLLGLTHVQRPSDRNPPHALGGTTVSPLSKCCLPSYVAVRRRADSGTTRTSVEDGVDHGRLADRGIA